MKSKVLIIFLSVFIIRLVVSCCDCGETTYTKYTHFNLSVKNIDNSGEDIVVSTDSLIVKTAYGIQLDILRKPIEQESGMSAIAFTSANAVCCECGPEFESTPLDSITDVKVFTINDFNEDYPAGTDISACFNVYTYKSFSSISTYIKNISYVLFYDGYDESYEHTDTYFFRLKINLLLMDTSATSQHPHKFKVQVFLSDGRIFEQETPEINLI